MSRYANVGNGRVVEKAAFKHTTEVVDEPNNKRHKNHMQKDLIKKYELIKQLKELGMLEILWFDNFVEFKKTINGVNYEQFTEWYAKQLENERRIP